MRFRYEAVDGYEKTMNWTEEKAREELGSGYDFGSFYAVSFDGVNTLTPMDDRAEALFREFRDGPDEDPGGGSNKPAGPPDKNPGWEAERAAPGGDYMSAEGALYDRLEREAPEIFSNGDGTGQVDLRLLPSGY